MNRIICVAAFFMTLVWGASLQEPASISVYTTLSPAPAPPNVYQQLASNLAGKITSPILTFLGFNKQNATQAPPKRTKPLNALETLDPLAAPVDNALHPLDREVEEVTTTRQHTRRPEKFTLYSGEAGYLPSNRTNVTNTRADTPKPKDGPLTFFLEFLGSIAELAMGAFMAIFKPDKPNPPPTSQ